MAGATGVNEAGTAFITISVNDQTSEALAKVSESLQDFTVSSEKAVESYSNALDTMAAKSQSTWASIGQSSEQLGNALMTPWRMFSGAGKDAVGIMSDFDDQIRSASAKISGSSAEDIDMLREKAKLLGRTMSFTASEVASGMVNLAQNGFSASEIDQSIKPVMDLARATGTDVATAAEIASNALRSFGKPASEMGHVCDVLSATANSSSQSLVDLGYAVKYSSANYANAGTSLEEYMKLIGTLANYGTKGSSAGTGLRKIMTQAVSPKTAKLFEQLGIATTDANGNLKEMAELLPEVATKMEGMGSGERTAWLKELFGASGMTGAQSLMNGADAFDTMKSNIDNAEGTAASTAEGMDAGIGGSERMMTSAIEGLQIAFGEAVSGPMKQFYDMINGIATAVSEWVSKHEQLVALLAESTAAAAGLGAAFLGLAGAISVTQKAFAVMPGIMTAFSQAAALLCANPMAVVIGAAASAAVLLAGYLIKSKLAAEAYSDAAVKMTEAHEQQNDADNQAIQRLQQLAEKQSLTTQEFAEAQNVILGLSARYKDLGISVDYAGKSISVAADAQEKMQKAQLLQRISDVRKEKEEAKQNAEKSKKKLDKWSGAPKGEEDRQYTLEELQALDEQWKKESPLKRDPVKYSDRAVIDESTGKWRLVDTGTGFGSATGFKLGVNPIKYTNEAKKNYSEQLDIYNASTSGIESLSQEEKMLQDQLAVLNGTAPAPSEQVQTPDETVPVQTAEPAVKTEYPGDDEYSDTALEQKYGNRGDLGDGTDTDVEAADQVTVANTSGDPVNVALDPKSQEDFNKANSFAEQGQTASDAYQQQVNQFQPETPEVNTDELEAEIADAQSQIDAINAEQQNAEQTAKVTAEETGTASNQVQNGPGSAAMGPMNLNDKSIVETAEYSRQSAELLKKIYDCIKSQDNSAAFAQ